MFTPILASLLLITATATDLDGYADGDWPAWRGAHQDGVSGGSPPVEFGEGKNIKWKAPLPGRGLSTPIIIGERVFVTSAVPKEGAKPEEAAAEEGGFGRRRRSAPLVETDFVVLAFDRADGSPIWKRTARTQTPHEGTHPDGSLAAPSIVSDGKSLFVSFGSYGLFAYDFDGELLWEVDLGDMSIANSFGEGSSPVIADDALVLLWDHEGDSFITALDRTSGKELWRTERDRGTNWGTPLVARGTDGKTQIIVASDTTDAYDAATGEKLWSCGTSEGSLGGGGRRGNRRGGIIASPILHDGVLIFATGTRGGGSILAIHLEEAQGDKVEESDAMLWRNDRAAPRIPSPIAHDGILYALKSSSGLLSAFDIQSGETIYTSQRLEGVADVWASPIVAGEHIYILGRDGTVEVVATGVEMETLAVNHLEEIFDASPAVAGNELYLRGRSQLYCIAATD